MANNIDKKEPVAICDQSKIDVTKCDNHELAGNIEPLIKVIRGQQVMLDKDLATLYGVETRVLNQTVKRNIERFPDDFRFELSREECLRSQIVISNGRGGNRYSTYAFTEQGVAMLSSVLRSQTAIEVNIQIMRAFVSMRHFMVNNASVFSRLETIEYHQLEMQQHQQETDKRIDEVFRRLDEGNAKPKQGVFYRTIFWKGTKQKLVMRFCAILILSVISILNSLELKSQTVVNILSNGYKLERSLFLHGKKSGYIIKRVD